MISAGHKGEVPAVVVPEDVFSSRPANGSAGDRLVMVITPLAVLVVWEVSVRLGYLHSLFFPPPSLVFQTIARLTLSGELPGHVLISLQRVFLGFFLGAAPGVLLGMSMGWSRRVRAAIEPMVSALYPVPKVALLPMILLLFGIGELSKVVLVAIGAFFPAVINAMTGVMGISPVYFEAAANCGAGRWKTFTRVIIPGSLPVTLAGIRLAFGMALILVVTAEFVAARSGVGAMIWLAWETLRTEKLYAGVVTWAFLGLVSTWCLRWVEASVIRWRPQTS